MKIVSWNIKKGNLPDYNNQIAEIKEMKPDIVCHQEDIHPRFKVPNFVFGRSYGNNGVSTGAKEEILEHVTFVSRDKEFFIGTPKAILATTHNFRNRSLLVVNIHGLNFAGTKALLRQIEDTQLLLKNHLGPIIYIGDFNTKNNRRLKKVTRLLYTSDLKPVLFENETDGRYEGKNKILDLAFSRGVRVTSAKYIKRELDHPLMVLEII